MRGNMIARKRSVKFARLLLVLLSAAHALPVGAGVPISAPSFAASIGKGDAGSAGVGVAGETEGGCRPEGNRSVRDGGDGIGAGDAAGDRVRAQGVEAAGGARPRQSQASTDSSTAVRRK